MQTDQYTACLLFNSPFKITAILCHDNTDNVKQNKPEEQSIQIKMQFFNLIDFDGFKESDRATSAQ